MPVSCTMVPSMMALVSANAEQGPAFCSAASYSALVISYHFGLSCFLTNTVMMLWLNAFRQVKFSQHGCPRWGMIGEWLEVEAVKLPRLVGASLRCASILGSCRNLHHPTPCFQIFRLQYWKCRMLGGRQYTAVALFDTLTRLFLPLLWTGRHFRRRKRLSCRPTTPLPRPLRLRLSMCKTLRGSRALGWCFLVLGRWSGLVPLPSPLFWI